MDLYVVTDVGHILQSPQARFQQDQTEVTAKKLWNMNYSQDTVSGLCGILKNLFQFVPEISHSQVWKRQMEQLAENSKT